MNIPTLLQTLQNTTLAAAVRGELDATGFVFPIVELIHVIFLSLVFGSILMIDSRLLGFNTRLTSVSKLSEEVLPWTWSAFIGAVITGSLLFISKAEIYYANPQFRYKFLCMALAGINMAIFHFGAYRQVNRWDTSTPPTAARVAGALSILLWVGVITFGRWIGFTT